jgi:hypothetical protein
MKGRSALSGGATEFRENLRITQESSGKRGNMIGVIAFWKAEIWRNFTAKSQRTERSCFVSIRNRDNHELQSNLQNF